MSAWDYRWNMARARMFLERSDLARYRALRRAFCEMAGFEYSDNFRVADVRSPDQLTAYARAQKGGCCGQYDAAIRVGHRTFLVGCNFGH